MAFEEISYKEELKIKIAYYRKKRGLTQKEVAERMGMTRSSYAYAETKANRLSSDFLTKLSRILEVPVNHLAESQPLTADNTHLSQTEVSCSSGFVISKKEERIIKMFRMLSDDSYDKIYNILRKEYEDSMEEDN